ncbi:MAG: WYL domain-containing protein [Spirochaetota bacterium]
MVLSLHGRDSLETQLLVIQRSLHILALVQHATDEKWNKKTLADILSFISYEGDEPLTNKKIESCISWLKNSGFPLETQKGCDRMSLSQELSTDQILDIVALYFPLAINTMGVRDCFRPFVEKNSSRSLWMIARIYFASLEKRKITIHYIPETGEEKEHVLSPYHWIYRDSSVYLAAANGAGDIRLYKFTRIKDLFVTDEHFNSDVPSADELMKYSMGAFISNTRYDICIEFESTVRQRIIEDFGRLPFTEEKSPQEGFSRICFTVCDLLSVCRIVFGYCGRAVIVSPKEARHEMKRLIEGNAGQYV